MYVTNSDGNSESLITSKKFTGGSYIGVVGNYEDKLAGYVALTKVNNVGREDFKGTDCVSIGDYQVPIADDVQVYNSATGTWTTLALAKAYTDSFTVCYDKTPATGAK